MKQDIPSFLTGSCLVKYNSITRYEVKYYYVRAVCAFGELIFDTGSSY